jgi:hypothetical protein
VEDTKTKGEDQMKRQYDILYKNLICIGAALICFLLLLPAFRLTQTEAQIPPTGDTNRDSDLDSRIQTFFMTLQRTTISTSAFDELLRGSPLGSLDADQRSGLRSKVDDLKKDFGEIINWEEYESKQIGKDVRLVRYILKYEHYPVIWTFAFYRKPTTSSSSLTASWVLVKLEFDTELR